MTQVYQTIYSLDTIDTIVTALYHLVPLCSVFTCKGDLGAGKTTLIKRLLLRCGVTDSIVSPTFTYVIPYTNSKGEIFYHFDLYRMPTLQDFIDAGFNELLYAPHSWSFIEWPEIIMPLLTKKACHIVLDYYTEQERIITYTVV
jgi:tRNA threonylcarbamoyladenosine biosynthesis protein TsaE